MTKVLEQNSEPTLEISQKEIRVRRSSRNETPRSGVELRERAFSYIAPVPCTHYFMRMLSTAQVWQIVRKCSSYQAAPSAPSEAIKQVIVAGCPKASDAFHNHGRINKGLYCDDVALLALMMGRIVGFRLNLTSFLLKCPLRVRAARFSVYRIFVHGAAFLVSCPRSPGVCACHRSLNRTLSTPHRTPTVHGTCR